MEVKIVFTVIVMVALIVWAFKQIATELKLGEIFRDRFGKD